MESRLLIESGFFIYFVLLTEYWPVYTHMKIRFLKNWVGEVEKKKLQETWDVSYSKWTELNVDEINTCGNTSLITTYDGDIIQVPVNVFEVIKKN